MKPEQEPGSLKRSLVVALVVGALSASGWIVSSWLGSTNSTLRDHETRISKTEAAIQESANDRKWIRQALERIEEKLAKHMDQTGRR